MYINGQWLESHSNEYIEVQNPANEEIVAYVTSADANDVQYALETSEKAQLKWQALSPMERGSYLVALAEKLKEKKEYFAKLLVLEQGKTYRDALGEVDGTIEYFLSAVESYKWITGDVSSSRNNQLVMVKKVPYGVTLGLCAWNFPLALIGRKLGPALITGNTMIVKPHELTPVASVEFFQLIDEVGFPPGVVNLITGSGPEVGNLLVSSPKTRFISVTGSVKAGQAIYKAAAENIAGLCLELGGKAPFIVLEDADIDKAVEAATVSRFANCGQICVCCDMVFVHEKIADEFTEKLLKRVSKIRVGDPFSEETEMGPKVSKADLEKIHNIVKKTVEQGGKIAIGGEPLKGGIYDKGFWYPPTILTDVAPGMSAAVDEIFGPVLPILRIKDLDEAIQIANDSPYGLAAYIFTSDYSKFLEITNVLQVGTVYFNEAITGYSHVYHSGHKLSGLGGEDGEYGIEGYMQKRVLYMNLNTV